MGNKAKNPKTVKKAKTVLKFSFAGTVGTDGTVQGGTPLKTPETTETTPMGKWGGTAGTGEYNGKNLKKTISWDSRDSSMRLKGMFFRKYFQGFLGFLTVPPYMLSQPSLLSQSRKGLILWDSRDSRQKSEEIN